MSNEEENQEIENKYHTIDLQYKKNSKLLQNDTEDHLIIGTNTLRKSVNFKAKIKDTLMFRECLTTLYEVVSGDFSYKPKDRSAYLAYQSMKKQNSSSSDWEARQAYFDWLMRNDADTWFILDPVVSVFSDQITFEVFSKDEGAYAMLSISKDIFDINGEVKCGTTNIDFSNEFISSIKQMRSHRETYLDISSEQVEIETKKESENDKTIEKKIKLPDSWLRGFLQVQSASLLNYTKFDMKPIDLYNVIRHLSLNKDQKKGGRAIRIELVPGELPRLVLEPWNIVIQTSGTVYKGSRPEIIRLWGRKRLKILSGILGMAQSIEVYLLGSGMPAYFVIKMPNATFTLAITGFSSSNWSQGLVFDLLLPRENKENKSLDLIIKSLNKKTLMTIDELKNDLKIDQKELFAGLQNGCQKGLLMYDMNTCRLRPLLDEMPTWDELEFRNRKERKAHDLIAQKDTVILESEEHIHDIGVELVGKVKVKEEKREYRPVLKINSEGRVLKAECTCSFFRKHKLKEGPCEHLIALRIRFGQIEIERKENPNRTTVRLETRGYVKRLDNGNEEIYQLSLNEKRLIKRFNLSGKLKKHSMVYNSLEDARIAYFEQIDILESKGFIDTRG
ncbi:MAG: SWIM zinc finger family protein [Cyanobacteriota bacterium]